MYKYYFLFIVIQGKSYQYNNFQEYERERDQCPMHFDDGSNPWVQTENYVNVFLFGSGANTKNRFSLLFGVPLIVALYSMDM